MFLIWIEKIGCYFLCVSGLTGDRGVIGEFPVSSIGEMPSSLSIDWSATLIFSLSCSSIIYLHWAYLVRSDSYWDSKPSCCINCDKLTFLETLIDDFFGVTATSSLGSPTRSLTFLLEIDLTSCGRLIAACCLAMSNNFSYIWALSWDLSLLDF